MAETKKKILIIDDDSFLLDMYALKFTQSGFEVDTALGSEIALQKLQEGAKPDIILMDILMPVMDGFQLLEKINSEKICTASCKIILSNRGQQEDIERGKELGADGYIIKANATPAEVITQVTDILNKKGK